MIDCRYRLSKLHTLKPRLQIIIPALLSIPPARFSNRSGDYYALAAISQSLVVNNKLSVPYAAGEHVN